MQIRVLCSDKTARYVEEGALEDLIRKNVVVAFFRPGSNEWVDVRNGQIREKGTNEGYKGPERRKKQGR